MPTLPKQERPAREGARVASVETGLAAAAAKLAQQVRTGEESVVASVIAVKSAEANSAEKHDFYKMLVFIWSRSSRSLSKGNTLKSNVPRLLWSPPPQFRRKQPHLRHLLLQSLLQTSAQKGKWITSLLVCWTMSTQQDLVLLGPAVPEAAEPWPQVYSSLHGDLRCLHRTAIRSRVHHQPAWPARERQASVKVSADSWRRAAILWLPVFSHALFLDSDSGRRPKKGLATAKQRLGKILKIHRNGKLLLWERCRTAGWELLHEEWRIFLVK